MKKLFILNQLSMNWKEKGKTGGDSMKPADDQQMTSRRPAEKPVRFFRYVAMLLMLLTLGVGQMWADSSVSGASIKYDKNSSTNQWWNVSSTPKDLGQVYTFKLKGFWAELGTQNVCQNTCMYYGFTSACSLGNYNIQDPDSWSGSTKHFQTESMDVNILSGLTPNKYVLYAKFIGHGQKSGNSCGEISSSTYQMKFEYPAYLTGDGTWCGTEWNTTNDAQKMTYGTDYYTKTVSSVTKADHKLKVATYNWASSWGHAKYDATNSSNVYSESDASGNIQFQPAMAGDVTIKFKISDQTISIICAAPTITLDDEGGSGGDGSLNTYYGVAPTSVTVPERDGYSFAGYWTGDDGTGTQVIGANGAWLRNVSNYTNNDATWKWIVRANSTLHAKWTQDPTITLNSVSPSSSIVAGNDITLVGERANSSNTISFQYSTNSGSTWTDITPKTSSLSSNTLTITWAVPDAHGATQTFLFRAKLAEATPIYSSASDGVTVYNTKTFKVKNTNNWATMKVHRYDNSSSRESWPGSTDGITSAGGQWKTVVLTSEWPYFILNDNNNGNQIKGSKTYSYASSVTDGNCYAISSGTGTNLTFSSATCPSAPTSVTTSEDAPTSVTNAKMTIHGNIGGNGNDNITDYGFYYGTTSSPGTKAQVGTSNTTGAINKQLTGLTAGTTYYYKTYATNGQGTSYGDVESYKLPYKVTVSKPTGCYSITNSGTNYTNSTIEVTATKATGYTFSSWSTTNGTITSTSSTSTTNTIVFTPTSDNATIAPVYTENMTTVNLVASPTGKGTFTSGGTVTSVSAGVTTHPTVTAVPGTGYHLTGTIWSESSSYISLSATNTASTTITATGETGKSADLTATFTPNTYRVQFHRNGASESTVYQNFTYDVAQNLTANTYTRSGYDFSGWSTTKARADAGTVDYADEANVSNLTSDNSATFDLYASWTAKSYAVTLSTSGEEGYGSNAPANQTATYGSAMPTITPPTAANGYKFQGYWTGAGGTGTKYYNADGTSAKDWNIASATTLHAYFQKAAITALTASPSTVNGGATVTATPTVSPTPTGSTIICWTVLRDNNSVLEPQPTFTPSSGNVYNPSASNAVTFSAPSSGGRYKVVATLRTGTSCGAGTVLDSDTTNFIVASSHTVTIQYKCGDDVIQTATTTTADPLNWTSVSAPNIFGYRFSSWTAGDGITLQSSTTTNPNNIKASYGGTLTANYSKNDYIYFKNTLGWSKVYVYFYTSGGYWDESKGAGATGAACIGKGQMSLVTGETDVYYWDYGANITGGAAAATKYVAFTAGDGTSHANFNGFDVVYPMNGNNQGFSSGTPMFVPLPKTVQPNPNYYKNGETPYFDIGYWTRYIGGTGYSIDIFHSNGDYDKSVNFVRGETDGMPYTATVNLVGSSDLYIKVRRSSDLYYYSSTAINMSNASTAKDLTYDSSKSNKTSIKTNAAGDYVFTLSCAASGYMQISAKYPAAQGDYRILYKDQVAWSGAAHAASWFHPSAVIAKNPSNSQKKTDIVSFYVAKDANTSMKFQYISTIADASITWTDVTGGSIDISSITKSGVYNFYLSQPAGGASITVDSIRPYTGNYYIRSTMANSKWDNYTTDGHHLMNYSDYSEANRGFSHYWVKFINNGSDIRYVVANDYSPCISDTLVADYESSPVTTTNGILSTSEAGVNIRSMWNRNTNKLSRAYLTGPLSNEYLMLRSLYQSTADNNRVFKSWTSSSVNTRLNHANFTESATTYNIDTLSFKDNQNWVYQMDIYARPSATYKLTAKVNGNTTFIRGLSGSYTTAANIDTIIGGDAASETAYHVRMIYDFKSDRMVKAWMPTGEVSGTLPINADVMIIREHQNAGQQITFSDGSAKLDKVHTVYGVMRFNRWTLNNKSTAAGHSVLPVGDQKSSYERGLYWISFPFDVNLSDVFGFGTYGVDWIIEYYDGASRAANGFWKDTPSFWRYVMPDQRATYVLEAGKGYVLALDLARMKDDNSDFWVNNIEQIELFFPSTENVNNIRQTTAHTTADSHECTIDRTGNNGSDINKNRKKADSHWNIIGIPSYANYGTTVYSNEGLSEAVTWQSSPYTNDLPFLYEYELVDNTYTVHSGTTYPFKAMHAYMVQYHGDLYWKLASATTPSSIVARRTYAEKPQSVEFRLELQQNEKRADQTFVKLSNDEEVSADFAFNEDLCKEYNSNKANIYTFIEGYIPAAGNILPMTEQTTVVPVGVKIMTDGEYTFAIPDGTEGIGVTLIDNETGERTNLGLTDYTISLEAGTYDERFALEISPIKQTPTGVELLNGENGVRKVMIDGILYIVKDGKVFDARGSRVK